MLTLEERNDLICRHLSLADRIAASQFKKTPKSVYFEDLKSAALLGLTEAASNYKGTIPFENFAMYRIFGEIKDYLRSLAWKQGKNVGEVEVVTPIRINFEEEIDGLTEIRKKILRFYYKDELTLKEISERVSLSVSGVHTVIKSALKELRSAA